MIYSKKIILPTFYLLLLSSFLFAQTSQWRLIWDKNKEVDMKEYEVYRSIGSSDASVLHPNSDYAIISHHDSNHFLNDTTMELIDDELEKGVQIYYRLKAVDSSGLKSDFSEEVSAAIPLISISNQTIYKDQLSVQLNLDTCVIDPDHADNLIEWEIAGNSQVNINLQNRIATISRNDTSWFGTESIIFTASDPDSFFDEQIVQITFLNQSLLFAPVVNDIPNQTIRQGGAFTIINLDNYVSDQDNSDSEITWKISGNSNLSIDIDSNRRATISALDTNWTGSETFTFTATDPDNQSDSDQATFTVQPKYAPIVSDIPDQTIQEGTSFTNISLDDYVSDPDDADDQITWTFIGNSNLNISIDGSRNATISYPSGWVGSETIVFRATDPTGLYDEDNVTFTVSSLNYAPVVSDIPDQTIVQGANFTAINLDDYVDDPNNDDEDIIWTYQGNTNIDIYISNQIAELTLPDLNWTGSEIIIFIATNPDGLSGRDTTAFTVNSANNVYAYPMPFRPSQNGATDISFTNLPVGGELFIYDLLGYPVYQKKIESTTEHWQTQNQHEKWVRSGVYLYVVKDEKGKKVKSDKVIIIR